MQLVRTVAGAAVCLVVTGACCCGGSHGIGQLGSTPPTAALAHFLNFPADRVPRPIVLIKAAQTGPDFATVAQLNGFACRLFEVTGALPADGPSQATASWSDGTSASYPAMSAQETIQALRNERRADRCVNEKPVNVTGMRPGSDVFATDRGRARMTAWIVKLDGALGTGEWAYPAISPSAFWDTDFTPTNETATVSADGRSLTYTFTGTQPDGQWGNSYNGLVAESKTAVELHVQRIPNPTSAPDSGPAEDHPRSVTVTLQSALSGRVVINVSGFVLPVCPEAMGAGC